MLDDVKEVEFAVLRDTLALSDSLLSKQLAILGQAGYLRSRRAKRDSRQRVWLALTREGRAAFAEHVAALREIVGEEGRRTIANADKGTVSARSWATPGVARGTG